MINKKKKKKKKKKKEILKDISSNIGENTTTTTTLPTSFLSLHKAKDDTKDIDQAISDIDNFIQLSSKYTLKLLKNDENKKPLLTTFD